MPMVKASRLANDLKRDRAKTLAELREGLAAKHIKPEDFSLRELAAYTINVHGEPIGLYGVEQLYAPEVGKILEASEAVDSTTFSNITGQIIYSAILEGFNLESFVASRLIRTISTRLPDGEKIPGITKLQDQAEGLQVGEGMAYPHVGLGEDWIQTPAPEKRGLIVPVTREAILFDRTGVLIQRARDVGEVLGLNKEKRCMDVVIGAINNFNWRGTTYDTFQPAAPWVNVKPENVLQDWTSVEAAELVLRAIKDPNTGEALSFNPSNMTLLVPPSTLHTARRVASATEVRTSTGATQETLAPNPLDRYQVETSQLMRDRLIAAGINAAEADEHWFFGDFSRAFAYMENWPITVSEAPANSEAEFTQDIVQRFKASERGVCAVLEPRRIVKCYNSTTLA